MASNDRDAPARAVGRPWSFDREQALHQAMETFWARGYDGTSVADLTDTLGIAPPSLYKAFGDKRALFRAAVDMYYAYFIDYLDTALDDAPTAHDAISAVLHGVAEFYSRPGQPRGCLVNTSPPPAGDAETWAYLRGLRIEVRNRLRDRIQVGVEAGELGREVDIERLADLYWNTILGMSMRSRDGAGAEQLHDTATGVMATWPPPRAATPSPPAARRAAGDT
jgi:AcrR family transcriptional regulator